MDPGKYKIIDLIPQRPPMVMIDSLTYIGENFARGCLYIKASNVFCNECYLHEAGILEFIAQTAATWKGYMNLSEGREVKTGIIALIKNLSIYSLPAVDTEIKSEIIIEDEILDYMIITGRATQYNSILAEGEIRILTKNQGINDN